MAYGSLSRATLLHDVGYLESGLQSSYESIVLGDELVGYARQFMREVPVDDYSLALDEIKAAGPGGNHLGTKYTRRHHREFWTPALLDHAVHDRWAAEGATTLGARVRERLAGCSPRRGPSRSPPSRTPASTRSSTGHSPTRERACDIRAQDASRARD